MGKRGISAIVATILLILVTVAGIGILWGGILPLFKGLNYISYSDIKLEVLTQGYTVYDPDMHFAFVQVARGNDNLNLTGVEIIFDINGSSVPYRNYDFPTKNSKKTYKFNFTHNGITGAPSKVGVAPVFKLNGQERVGEVVSNKVIPNQKIELTVTEWNESNVQALTSVIREDYQEELEQSKVVYYYDGDNDGYSFGRSEKFLPGKNSSGYFLPEGLIALLGDCNDSNPSVNPNMSEVCGNDLDDECDGSPDWDDSDCGTVGYFTKGNGSLGSPFIIYTCYQLQNIESGLSSNYALGRNIDCSVTRNWNGGSGFRPIGNSYYNSFIGSLNGRDFEIRDLFINRASETYVGLFGYFGSSFSVRNLGLVSSNITGNKMVGGLVGYAPYSGEIVKVYNTGSVRGIGQSVGGIAGGSYVAIRDSYNTGSVSGSYYVGGVAGEFYNSLNNSYNTGSVSGSSSVGGVVGTLSGVIDNAHNTGSVSGGSYTGGVAGYSLSSSSTPSTKILNSYNTGSINGSSSVGGIAGSAIVSSPYANAVNLSKVYNTGSINGSSSVGGIVGYSYDETVVSDSYNTGSINGSGVGVAGLVGTFGYSKSFTPYYSSKIIHSYSVATVKGASSVGRLLGSGNGAYYSITSSFFDIAAPCSSSCNYYGTSLTNTQMRDAVSFSGFDFVNVWAIDSGTSYPYLIGNEQSPHPGI